MIRVLLCDDAADARELARVLLEDQPGIEVVGEAANGEEAVARAHELRPDVVLMDVEMPVVDGVGATHLLRKLLPETRIVAYAGSDDLETVMRMVEAGASAYCLKGAAPWELARAIAGVGDPLLRLAHALARLVGESPKAELIARELRGLTGARATGVFLVSPDGELGAAGAAEASLADAAAAAYAQRSLVVDGPLCAVPLIADGDVLGALAVELPDGREPDAQLLAPVADLAAASFASERRLELVRAEARMDVLTGLPNRRAFEEALDESIATALAARSALAVVLLDLDDFKLVNDTRGHAAGDEVLRRVGLVLRRTVRADEEVFRIGGEEFAVVVKGGREPATRVAKRARGALRGDRRGQPLPTVSGGVATLPGDAVARDELLRRADAALYAAKWAGKDRVLAYAGIGADADADAATAAESVAFPPPEDDRVLVSAGDLRRLLELERGQGELLRDAYRETIFALSAVLESKDTATGAHSQRVQRYALELAAAVEPRLLEDESLEYGFLLHDVGKIGIPDRILLKRAPLTPSERRLMETHSTLGEQLLDRVELLRGEGLRVVRSHHERWDGRGYPDRLAGAEIPLGARIFAVADTLDAMTSERPYRPAVSWDEAVAEVVALAGRQFDPRVVEAFCEREPALRRSYRELAAVA